MDPSAIKVPSSMKDMTIENITENTIGISSQGSDPRTNYIVDRLITHLHDFARETRLSTKEWMAGIDFLTAVGQKCSEVRQEFILLSDILGFSLLIDSIDHPKPPPSTEGSVLGPFHTHEAKEMPSGEHVSHDINGEPCLVLCTVKDSRGAPVEGAKIDVWETDSSGHYDVQYADRDGPDGRCWMRSKADGSFWFKCIKPVPYPIPHDGPVGKLLQKLGRHPYRPAHLHFMFEKEGYDNLITALYLRGDPYETSDAVFGVKDSLLVDLHPANEDVAREYGVEQGTHVIKWDFVLASDREATDLRNQKSIQALRALGRKVKLLDGLPVPDVD